MADEITSVLTLTVVTPNTVTVSKSENKKITMTGDAVSHHTQDVSTNEEKLQVGLDGVTMANEGVFFIKNLGGASTTAADYISLGPNGSCSAGGHTDQTACEADSKTWTLGEHMTKLMVGESTFFRGGLVVLSVRCDGPNDSQLEIISAEN
jgi:hypothetical protein